MEEQQPQTPPTGLPETSRFGASRMIIMIGVIILMGVIGVGAYILGTKSNNTPVQVLTPTPTALAQITPTMDLAFPSVTTTALDTTSWNTYSNPSENYSIKYPKGIFTRLICPDEQLDLAKQDASQKETIDMPTCGRDGRYDIEVTTRTQAPTIPQNDPHFSIKEEQVMLDGVMAKKYTVALIKPFEGPSPSSWYQEVVVSHNNKVYDFYLGKQEFEKTFSDILTTFKFL